MSKTENEKNFFYLMEYENDTPYHESIERWIYYSIQELKECYEEWMEDSIVISFVKWGEPPIYLSDSFEDIDIQNFQNGNKLPNNISFCKNCQIYFNRKLKKCKNCKQICVNDWDDITYEKLYNQP